MMQTLLQQWFKLQVHHETRDIPALALVVTRTVSSSNYPDRNRARPGGRSGGDEHVS